VYLCIFFKPFNVLPLFGLFNQTAYTHALTFLCSILYLAREGKKWNESIKFDDGT